jgi:hypothetical protein
MYVYFLFKVDFSSSTAIDSKKQKCMSLQLEWINENIDKEKGQKSTYLIQTITDW